MNYMGRIKIRKAPCGWWRVEFIFPTEFESFAEALHYATTEYW